MIIYIEDNVNNQRLMERMLSKRNLQLQVYDTVEAGLDAILESEPELIFVDMHLKSRLNGLDLVAKVRAEGIKTPIVIVTVFNMLADRKRAIEAGCDDYLAKPYNMEELFKIIDRFLPS